MNAKHITMERYSKKRQKEGREERSRKGGGSSEIRSLHHERKGDRVKVKLKYRLPQ